MADGARSAAYEVVRGQLVKTEEVEQRPLPSIEEFARFLYEKGGDTSEVRHAVHRLLQTYAGTWANVEGVPNHLAQQKANELFDSLFLSAAEQQADADFSTDDGR